MLSDELQAFTPAACQRLLTVLAAARRHGVADVVEIEAALRARIEAGVGPVAEPLPDSSRGRTPRVAGGKPCPSCGRGPLAPVHNSDGLHIVGCRLCRYSEVAA